MIILSEASLTESEVHSSKGNQLKWKVDNIWYKADFLGYEGAAEYFVYKILEHSNVCTYVEYSIDYIQYNGRMLAGCVSNDFLHDGQRIVTAERLFMAQYGKLADYVICDYGLEGRIEQFVDCMEAMTDISDFGAYLTMLLELDAITLNEDRHFHNIAVLQNYDGSFEVCPVFDNGAAFLSDTRNDYPLGGNVKDLIPNVSAKPFSLQFDAQMEVCEHLYGKQLSVSDFDTSECLSVIEQIYGNRVSDRIRQIYEYQKEHYCEFFI
ncbi:MAG: hypothetical protein NC180_04480 [Muribaculaceae bacterium]|nr:hypothetical protein [Roseburia sp.]MCM1430339.1 hypothetical protein [Muribaculaceae bacterium]MCM1492465.1 hypothetical protein [Muribaculaceae bacterium]